MEALEGNDVFNSAKVAVFHLLKYRARTEAEIRKKLETKRFSKGIIDQIIDYLKDLTLVDDKKFAREWTGARLKRPFGMNRIRAELQQKGIDNALIDDILNEFSQDYDEGRIVLALARKKASQYGAIERGKIQQRVYHYLLRRGFHTDVILNAINEL